MLAIVENKWDIKYIQILPVPTEGCSGKCWRKSEKFSQCKVSHTLKIDGIEIPDNKNIWKLFSKC